MYHREGRAPARPFHRIVTEAWLKCRNDIFPQPPSVSGEAGFRIFRGRMCKSMSIVSISIDYIIYVVCRVYYALKSHLRTKGRMIVGFRFGTVSWELGTGACKREGARSTRAALGAWRSNGFSCGSTEAAEIRLRRDVSGNMFCVCCDCGVV